MKDLKTVLETLNSDTVCLPDSIVKTMLSESGLMTLVSAKGNMEKHELGYRVEALGKRLVDTSRDDAVMHDMFTMEQYRDILLAEAELIQFVMEYRTKLGDEANKDFDWSSMEKKDDKPKIVGKVDLDDRKLTKTNSIKVTTTDSIVISEVHGFWTMLNTYTNIGTQCQFDTKEEAIEYYQKEGYTFTDIS